MTSTKTKPAPQHKAGSRKARVHELFDKQGAEAAWTLGLKLKLAQSTLRSWLATWRREATTIKKKPAKQTATPKAIPTPATSIDQPETIPAFLQG